MKRPAPVLCAVALFAAGCKTETPLTPGTADSLDRLPLSVAARQELTDIYAKLDTPEARQACTADEITFTKRAVALYALYIEREEPGARSWTKAEEARIEKMRTEWEALGGDTGDVSARCSAFTKSF
ncbi:hypothetical protein VK792_09195 [Mesobacterium sp. TK19101]|uniref:Lipoprotein n=1 Tax=Mesobacterium hydrothermale TaxID=3111907 RepID=A0ABU6HJ46_9RHOB|nr:hypothetical protein [Mesobacterium sp. TK19101]MEC3861458.1 hypothetical protein [Mesobacterium sp. TK19101]